MESVQAIDLVRTLMLTVRMTLTIEKRVKLVIRCWKVALRALSSVCSLIVVAMIAYTVAVIVRIPTEEMQTGSLTPQTILLTVSSLSLLLNLSIMRAYVQGSYRQAERRASWRGLVGFSLIVLNLTGWAVGGGIFLFSQKRSGTQSFWHTTCHPSSAVRKNVTDVDLGLLCRLQVRAPDPAST